jgi:hypothetical protein
MCGRYIVVTKIKEIEKKCDSDEAEDETCNSLKIQHKENKGWELVEQERLKADAIVEKMADSIYFSQPESAPPKP